jgi:hypothetical protein
MPLTFRALALGALLLIVSGCAGRLDAAIGVVNGSREFLAAANDGIAVAQRAARDAAIAAAPDAETARRDVAAAHARALVVWTAYERARYVWIGAAASIRAAQAIDAAGGDYEPRDVSLALLELGAAYEAFRRAALSLAVKAPVLP